MKVPSLYSCASGSRCSAFSTCPGAGHCCSSLFCPNHRQTEGIGLLVSARLPSGCGPDGPAGKLLAPGSSVILGVFGLQSRALPAIFARGSR
eukprot:279676-Pyramimonas_sp.AAC.1